VGPVKSAFPAFFLSLLITIPWSKHYWAGEGQAVLGGTAISFYFGIALRHCGCRLHAQAGDTKQPSRSCHSGSMSANA
jgi:hypothetical protein